MKFIFSELPWICFWSTVITEGVMAEICHYQISKYDIYGNVSESSGYTKCRFGCCSEDNSPCCLIPMKIVIGFTVGGLMGLAILCICCYCKYQRVQQLEREMMYSTHSSEANEMVQNNMTSPSHNIGSSTESGEQLTITHEVFGPPPSYEEATHIKTDYGFQTADT